MLSHIVERLSRSSSVEKAVADIRSADGTVRICGLLGSSTAVFTSILHGYGDTLTAVICPDGAEDLREDFESLLGDNEVLHFPDWEILPYDEFSPHEAIVGTRLRTLSELLAGHNGVVVIPVRAFLRRIIPPEDLAANIIRVELKAGVRPEALIRHLAEMGYARTQVVEDIGTFAVRGGIIDIYAQGFDNPVRIEFFGNEVESIREFDPITQRSVKKVASAEILPAREVVLKDEAIHCFMSHLKGKRLKGRQIEEVAIHVKDRFFFDGMEAYAPYFFNDS